MIYLRSCSLYFLYFHASMHSCTNGSVMFNIMHYLSGRIKCYKDVEKKTLAAKKDSSLPSPGAFHIIIQNYYFIDSI